VKLHRIDADAAPGSDGAVAHAVLHGVQDAPLRWREHIAMRRSTSALSRHARILRLPLLQSNKMARG